MGSEIKGTIDGFMARGGETPHVNPNHVIIVGLDAEETPDNWFAHCARLKDETDAELTSYVEDVRRTGKIDDPIDVYRDGNKLVVLDGRRSVRVARIIWAEQAKRGVAVDERVTVRALIRRGPSDELFRYNVDSHKKKALTTTQRAKQFLTYFQATGEDTAKTAIMFSCTEATVRNMLKIFDLAVEAQVAIDNGFPMREAIKLAGLPREEQKKTLVELRAAGALKGRKAANGISDAKKGKKVTGDGASRMLSRKKIEEFRDALKAAKEHTAAALFDFVLGNAKALDGFSSFKKIAAGEEKPKKGKAKARNGHNKSATA